MFQTNVVEKINTHILCPILPPPPKKKNCAVYEVMQRNIVEPDRPQMTVWRMRTACSIPKATNTHSEHVIVTAFPRQQWLHERASMLRYTYIESPVRDPQRCSWGFHSFDTWHRVNGQSIPDVSRQRDSLILTGQNVITKVGNRLSNDAMSYLRRL